MNFFNYFFTKLHPHQFFVGCATFFGLLFIVLTPPFQAPDEFNHFYRAYQISQGDFIAVQKDRRVGGEIPQSLVAIGEDFRTLTWTFGERTSFNIIRENLKIPLKPEEKVFVDFANTAMYTPVSYLPQAFAIFVMRPFDLAPLLLFYWVRLITLLCWIVALYYAIRLMPFYKWAFTFLILLPMSVWIHTSISADMVTNALAFFSIAYVFHLAYKEQFISRQQVLILFLLTFLLTSAKIVYAPILLAVLFIPKEKFGSRKKYYLQLTTGASLAFLTALYWSGIMKDLYLPYEFYNPTYRNGASLIDCADMYRQTDYILAHGSYILFVFMNSLHQSFDMYYQGFIGTFGWLDTFLPSWYVKLAYVILVLVFLWDGKKEIKSTFFQKGILLIGFLLMLCLILLTQHLTWDCVGGDVIVTIQGRYFIPVAPFVLLLFYNTQFCFYRLVPLMVVFFAILGLSLSAHVLYERYYKKAVLSQTIMTMCDAEEVLEGNTFKSNRDHIFFENANTQSNEKARSGHHAVKVNAENPYTLTHHMYDCERGDSLTISVWRWGKKGRIALENRSYKIYAHAEEALEKDSAGWERIELRYIVKQDLKGDDVFVYLFNGDQDSSYFDDIRITHQKLE